MRFLQLTSPYMHGDDVKSLQNSCNSWLTSHAGQLIPVDGVFGPVTKHAVGVVAWQMGLGHTSAEPAIQRMIEHPGLRSPEDHIREKKRAEASKKQGTGLQGVISHALAYQGVHENPPGSNWGDPEPAGWEHNFGVDHGPWCGCFAGSMILLAGGHVTSRVAYVPYIVADAHNHIDGFDAFVAWNGDRSIVKPGWLVCYDWNGNHSFGEHVGVVKEITSGGVIACEGNTGGANPGNGGEVAVASRDSSLIIGYCRPRF